MFEGIYGIHRKLSDYVIQGKIKKGKGQSVLLQTLVQLEWLP
jgi:hypothetical protein